jgi:hypothetical protein
MKGWVRKQAGESGMQDNSGQDPQPYGGIVSHWDKKHAELIAKMRNQSLFSYGERIMLKDMLLADSPESPFSDTLVSKLRVYTMADT